MKAKVEIPKGWRIVKPGAKVRPADMVLEDARGYAFDTRYLRWRQADYPDEMPVGADELIIRRVVQPKARKK